MLSGRPARKQAASARFGMRVKECLDTPYASYNAGYRLFVVQHMQYGQAGMRRLCELDRLLVGI